MYYTSGIRPIIILIPDKEPNYRAIWLNTGHLATPILEKKTNWRRKRIQRRCTKRFCTQVFALRTRKQWSWTRTGSQGRICKHESSKN